ncbi:MAG: TQO small subunit DoxD [Pirellulales bacterium]
MILFKGGRVIMKLTGWKIIAALVLLRLCVGWHFFSEGTKKLTYDRGQNQWRLSFSAAGFFNQAVGPFAGLYKSQVPGGHDWQKLLAVPKQAVPLSTAEQYQRSDEIAKYQQSRKLATKEKKPIPIESPAYAPYHDWASHIVDDWRAKLKTFTDLPGLTKEQQAQAAEQFTVRHQELADYLADELEAIEEYQHDLWRLARAQAHRGANEIPYQEQRIVQIQAETARSPRPWIATVSDFEAQFRENLLRIVSVSASNKEANHEKETVAASNPSMLVAARSVLTDAKEKRMDWMSLAVACTVTGVGVCLLLGFFTRLASVVGALFLFSVITTQPPWVATAAPTINQAVEMMALLVLAATAAGRWAGIDFFTHAFCQKFCKK